MTIKKPKEIAGMYIASVCIGLVAGFLIFVSAASKSSYNSDVSGLDVLGYISMLVAAILGIIATYRLVESIDWLVNQRHAAIVAASEESVAS